MMTEEEEITIEQTIETTNPIKSEFDIFPDINEFIWIIWWQKNYEIELENINEDDLNNSNNRSGFYVFQ